MAWQVQEAKQRFSELVERTLREGPQTVTRRGEEVVVVIPAEEFKRLSGQVVDFKDFLLSGPDIGKLDIHRDEHPAQTIDL